VFIDCKDNKLKRNEHVNGNDLKLVLPPRVYWAGYASVWGFAGVVIRANTSDFVASILATNSCYKSQSTLNTLLKTEGFLPVAPVSSHMEVDRVGQDKHS
jgi:hypothetical protein